MTQTSNSTFELKLTAVRYYSTGDERAFFEWLDRIPCVTSVEGRASTLYLSSYRLTADEDVITELLSLYHRYDIDMSELIAFDRDDVAEWLRNSNAFWYKKIFK
jgi:hypothetical protein